MVRLSFSSPQPRRRVSSVVVSRPLWDHASSSLLIFEETTVGALFSVLHPPPPKALLLYPLPRALSEALAGRTGLARLPLLFLSPDTPFSLNNGSTLPYSPNSVYYKRFFTRLGKKRKLNQFI